MLVSFCLIFHTFSCAALYYLRTTADLTVGHVHTAQHEIPKKMADTGWDRDVNTESKLQL